MIQKDLSIVMHTKTIIMIIHNKNYIVQINLMLVTIIDLATPLASLT